MTDLPGLGLVHLHPFLCEREGVPPAAVAEGASRAPSGGDESAAEPGGGGAAVPEVDVAALLRDMPPLGASSAAPLPPRPSLSSLTVACAVILPLMWVLLAASDLLPAPAVACAVAALFALLACLAWALAGREKGLHANHRLRLKAIGLQVIDVVIW